MTYIAYILLLAMITLGLLIAPSNNLTDVISIGVVILGHLPILLKIAVLKQIVSRGFGALSKLPEIASLLPVLVVWLLAWSQTTLIMQVSGIATVIALVVCLASVKGISLGIKRATNAVATAPGTTRFAASRLAMASIFVLRLVLGVISAFALSWSFRGPENAILPIMMLVFALFAIIAVACILLLTYSAEKQAWQKNKRALNDYLAANLQQLSPTVAVYYSSKAKKHDQLIHLIKALKQANTQFVVICREAAPIKEIKANTNSAFLAKTIDTLDSFVVPSLKVALYVNDAEKNGHFVRFNQLRHVFLAQDFHVPAGVMPKNFQIYHAIVAPNKNIFDRWQPQSKMLNIDVDYMRGQGDGLLLTGFKTSRVIENRWTLCCSIHAASDKTEWLVVQAWLDGLMEKALTSEAASLRLLLRFLPGKPDQGLAAEMQNALERHVSDLAARAYEISPGAANVIEVFSGSTSAFFDRADLILCSPDDDIDMLRTAGKPMLFANPYQRDISHCDTEGFYQLEPDHSDFNATIEQATTSDPLKSTRQNRADKLADQQNVSGYGSISALIKAQEGSAA